MFFLTLLTPLLLVLMPSDFIEVSSICKELDCKLYLASSKNPVGISLYSNSSCCVVHQSCYSNLISAALEAKSLGYTLTVVDALRPLYIQEALFAVIPNIKYVSKPGGEDDLHSRGLSVDVLLYGEKGPLIMPSDYLEPSIASHADFRDCSEAARFNRELLAEIMVKNGFKKHPYRWWEFQSTYWDTLSKEGRKAISPFNLSIEEILCPKKMF